MKGYLKMENTKDKKEKEQSEDNENYTDEEIERIVKDKTLIPSIDDDFVHYDYNNDNNYNIDNVN